MRCNVLSGLLGAVGLTAGFGLVSGTLGCSRENPAGDGGDSAETGEETGTGDSSEDGTENTGGRDDDSSDDSAGGNDVIDTDTDTDTGGNGPNDDEAPVVDITADLIGYIAIQHDVSRATFSDAEDDTDASTSADGTYRGGVHVSLSLANIDAVLGAFRASCEAEISAARQNGEVDVVAVRDRLASYRSSDSMFYAGYYTSVPWIDRDSVREYASTEATAIVDEQYDALDNAL